MKGGYTRVETGEVIKCFYSFHPLSFVLTAVYAFGCFYLSSAFSFFFILRDITIDKVRFPNIVNNNYLFLYFLKSLKFSVKA